MLSSIDNYKKFYSQVLNKKVVNEDDRNRMEAASKQATKAKADDEDGFRDIEDAGDLFGSFVWVMTVSLHVFDHVMFVNK